MAAVVPRNHAVSNVSTVAVMHFISCYLPNSDIDQSLAIIQREARTHNVQAHSLTLMYRGRARTIVHTARMLIFGLKLGAGWLQMWWTQAGKPNTFPLYRPLVDGSSPVTGSLNRPEIEVTKALALITTLSTLNDLSTRSCPTQPNVTTNVYALETYQPAASTESSSCYSGSQIVGIFCACVVPLALMIWVRSLPLKSKVKTTPDLSHHPMVVTVDEEIEYTARPLTLSQSIDSDSEDSEGGGVRLPAPAEKQLSIFGNRSVRTDPSGDAVSFPSTLRGGRRNVSVHWHKEHAKEVKEHERYEKRKRMTKDWRLRPVD
ncbi:MAG: hypothetical protein ALECFALPRED_004718 [Alectoria fallacina]|uniref:Uncharacterized protein n=1 Tax=Alectoria fallacina TaxID=1903189 RepID=A0A8H3FTT1_9LECA|nr:MAG: hypothetical protein ALECFALPRED_004718 [Alectoria fallacina]